MLVFFQQLFEKAPGLNWEKIINLTSKLGEINDIEHNKGSKIYPQNQVILDCIMPSIPLKRKCLSIILIWVIVSHKKWWSLKKVKKKRKKKILFLIGKNSHGIGVIHYGQYGVKN